MTWSIETPLTLLALMALLATDGLLVARLFVEFSWTWVMVPFFIFGAVATVVLGAIMVLRLFFGQGPG